MLYNTILHTLYADTIPNLIRKRMRILDPSASIPAHFDYASLKEELRKRRAQIGDDDADFPEMRRIIEEFWDYDEADRARAVEISHEYVEREKQRK